MEIVEMYPPKANAILANSTAKSINITINGTMIKLSRGDCIEFTKWGENGSLYPNTIAKIISFGWRHQEPYINRLFILPWIPGTPGGWLSPAVPGRWALSQRFIALSPEFLRDEDNMGDWRTIVALPNCPDEAPRAPAIVHTTGGRRKNRKNKRKTRKHRRH